MPSLWQLNSDCLGAICRHLTVDDLFKLLWCSGAVRTRLLQEPVVWECVRIESYSQRHLVWLLDRLIQLEICPQITRIMFVPSLATVVQGLYEDEGRQLKRGWNRFMDANQGALQHFHANHHPLIDVYWEFIVWTMARKVGNQLKTLAYQPYGEPVLSLGGTGKFLLAFLTLGFPNVERLLLGERVFHCWDSIQFVLETWISGLIELKLTDEKNHFGPKIIGGLLTNAKRLKKLTLVNSLSVLSLRDSDDVQGDFPSHVSVPTVRTLVIVHEHEPGLYEKDMKRLLKAFPSLSSIVLYTDVFAYFPDHDWTESSIMAEYHSIRKQLQDLCTESNVILHWKDLRP